MQLLNAMNVLSKGSRWVETKSWLGRQCRKQKNATSKAKAQSWLFGGISPQIHTLIVISNERALQGYAADFRTDVKNSSMRLSVGSNQGGLLKKP